MGASFCQRDQCNFQQICCLAEKASRSFSNRRASIHSLELLLRGNASCHSNSFTELSEKHGRKHQLTGFNVYPESSVKDATFNVNVVQFLKQPQPSHWMGKLRLQKPMMATHIWFLFCEKYRLKIDTFLKTLNSWSRWLDKASVYRSNEQTSLRSTKQIHVEQSSEDSTVHTLKCQIHNT